jgi:hypothetical protein
MAPELSTIPATDKQISTIIGEIINAENRREGSGRLINR